MSAVADDEGTAGHWMLYVPRRGVRVVAGQKPVTVTTPGGARIKLDPADPLETAPSALPRPWYTSRMTWSDIGERLIQRIMAEHPDPASWMRVLRHFAEGLGLRPERCLILGSTLEIAVLGVIDEARKQRRSQEAVAAAVEAAL